MPSNNSTTQKIGPIQELFNKFPKSGQLVFALENELLRGTTQLTLRDCELIAAYTSGLNGCDLCVKRHTAIAELRCGVEIGLVNDLLEDIETANCDDKLKPVFQFVKKLTQTPSEIIQADLDAIYAAGWDEVAFYRIVSICCYLNYINRLIEAYGFQSTLVRSDQKG